MLTGDASRRWTMAAYAYGAVVAAGIAYVQLGMPIQLTDGYTLMESLPARTLASGVYNEFFQPSFLRPFLWAQRHVLYLAADGRYFEWFRGWDVLQVLAVIGLSIRLWRPERWIDAAVVPFGLAVLVGMHTFSGAINEAFPINAYVTAVVACLLAANLALGPHRRWHDAAAIALFVVAALTTESGLLVWAVVAAASLSGARGVSRGAAVAVTALFAGYFVLRFGVLDVGSPGLIERGSGYGFAVREPHELIQIFGDRRLAFYGYNILSSALSVVWSEPRGGVWRFTAALWEGDVPPYLWVNILSSTLASGVLALFVWRRRRDWMAWRFDAADRIVVVFLGVLAANAVLSFPYTKDEIISPAGVFYAVAVGVAVRDLVARTPKHAWRSAAVALLLVVMSAGWTMRAVGLHLGLRESTHKIRNEWAYLEQWLAEGDRATSDPTLVGLQRRLYADAIIRAAQTPAFTGDWVEQWFGVE